MSDFVIRFVLACPTKEIDGYKLFSAAQGRNTYATAEEASEHLRAVKANNVPDLVPEGLQVMPWKCWPVHFDPKAVYADSPNYYPRLGTWSGDRLALRITGKENQSPNGERSDVTDLNTGLRVRVRKAACGLGCKCDASIVKVLG